MDDKKTDLETIEALRLKYPTLRLGQIIINLAKPDNIFRLGDLFYLSDKELMRRARKVLRDGWDGDTNDN